MFLRQTLRIMQLTAAFLLSCCLTVAARSSSQTVTFFGTNVPIEKVFNAIKEQTGYSIVSNRQEIRQLPTITVDAKDMPLADFLNEMFDELPLSYLITKRTIFIRKKVDKSPFDEKILVDVQGRVTDEEGNPLVGATVKVKGADLGTNTHAH